MLKSSAVFKATGKPDYFLLGLAAFLLFSGIIILASVSAPVSQAMYGTTYHFLLRQIAFGLLPGIFLGFLAFKINLEKVKKWAPGFFLASLILMVLVFLPFIGSAKEGAARWLSLGPFSLQPSEILKLASVLYIAALLSGAAGKKKGFSQTFLAVAVAGAVMFLLFHLQSDLSTLAVIITTAGIMYFSAGAPWWQIISGILAGSLAVLAFIRFEPYRLNRFLVFLNPGFDSGGAGYQATQALFAIGSGGLVGVGLGMSFQKLGFLPQAVSDSIFAVFSEETGFAGSSVLILLFLSFLWLGFRTAKRQSNQFAKLTALGITGWITVQAFVNIGSMTGLLPLTGIPLPFISYGGTALMTELAAVGLLLNISRKK